MRHLVALVILAVLLVPCITAAPTTNAATDIGNNNFTMLGSGVSGSVGWFEWGMQAGQSWAHTPNRTSVSGAINYTMRGFPVLGCTTYYYRACDPTGCGSEVSLMSLQVTPLPSTTFGQWVTNITENNGDLGNAAWNFMQPYIQVTGATIFFALVFMALMIGIWLRTRGTIIATMIGMIYAGLVVSSATALQLGMPPEFVAVGQALLYISLAGIFVHFTFR